MDENSSVSPQNSGQPGPAKLSPTPASSGNSNSNTGGTSNISPAAIKAAPAESPVKAATTGQQAVSATTSQQAAPAIANQQPQKQAVPAAAVKHEQPAVAHTNKQAPPPTEEKRVSKLNQWLHQTLQLGGQKMDTKIVHQAGPQKAGSQPHHALSQAPAQIAGTPGQQKVAPGQQNFGKSQSKKGGQFHNGPGRSAHGRSTGTPPSNGPARSGGNAGAHPRGGRGGNNQHKFMQQISRGTGGGFGPNVPVRQYATKVGGPGASGMQNTWQPSAAQMSAIKLGQSQNAQVQAAQAQAVQAKSSQAPSQKFEGKLRIIALGGLDEVGKNCMALEYIKPKTGLISTLKHIGAALKPGTASPAGPGTAAQGTINAKDYESEILIIDLGFQFPDEDMLGVDYIIPDMSYLEDKIDRIRGIVFTHGHLDHIGGVPYIIPKLNFPPMYGTSLTMGLVEKRLEEFGLQKDAKSTVITAEDTLQLGPFNVSFFPVNHSIPDAVGVIVKTPAGNIVHTGDFKFDHTPSGSQKPADFARIATLAYQNIAALFIDSTNALKPGHTITEKRIGESLESIIKSREGRILIASFSSQIGRIQQIVDAAKKHGRSIFLSGRSLIDNIFMASKLGYLNIPAGLVHDIRKVKKIPDHHALILTTGSQGEGSSALTRMGMEEHPAVQIKKGDTVVLSSSPIPGNERAVTSVTNNLCRLGAQIINNQIMDVHASGHAQQEDLKLMMSLVRPKYVVPVHGEYYMRYGNKELALQLGYDENHTVLIENGDVIEIENNEVKNKGEKVQNNYIMVDGLGVGDIGAQVIMDRQTLAENGMLIVLVPVDKDTHKLKGEVEVISRGFIYMSESEEVIKGIAEAATTAYRHIIEKRSDAKRADIKTFLRESIDKFVHQKIERHPLVVPIIVEK